MLRRFGGTAYLPAQSLDDLTSIGTSAALVEEAPEILQPVYVAVQRRRRHQGLVIQAVESLHSVAARHFRTSAS
jgi:hypothetical protein